VDRISPIEVDSPDSNKIILNNPFFRTIKNAAHNFEEDGPTRSCVRVSDGHRHDS
jgi:hypothetical protein